MPKAQVSMGSFALALDADAGPPQPQQQPFSLHLLCASSAQSMAARPLPKQLRFQGGCSAVSPQLLATSFSACGSTHALSVQRRPARGALPLASLSLAGPWQGTLVPMFASATASAQQQRKKDGVKGKNSKQKRSLGEVVEFARKRALAGGLPGMAAMALQVVALMWLRTTVNYQYRYGTSTMAALKTLYAQGGIPRFYQGMAPALIQGPLSRFGDTAANTGCLALLEDVDMPPALKTVAASLAAGAFRIFLMPVDAVKTIMQVEGKNGIPSLLAKIRGGGPTVLYHGALAASAATFVGHYPWFAMYNTLNAALPSYDELPKRLLRSAFIGFCCSFVSDCCSNSIRVVKTSKQASTVPITYATIVKQVIEKEGVVGLMGRGLGTKLISNGMQGILFSVLWRLGQDYYAKQEKEKEAAGRKSKK